MATTDTTGNRSTLLPQRVGRLLVAASWLTVLQGVFGRALHLNGRDAAAAWAGAALYLIGLPLAFERPGEIPLLLSGTGAVLLAFTVQGNPSFVAVIATIALAGRFARPATGRPIAVLTAAGYLAALLVAGHLAPRDVLSPAVGLLFAFVAASVLRQLREEQGQTRALLQEVIEGRDAQIEAAALNERARLAREIHDVLAHTLSALSVQLEGTRLLLERHEVEPATLATVDRARRLARDGLDEARRAVGALRGDMLPVPELLSQLAAGFQDEVRVPCRLDVEGEPVELPPEAQLTVYRTAQESLTNIRKHACPSGVTMRLRYDPKGVELTVEDEGTPRPDDLGGGGYGLRGLRERAALAGGSLEAGPTERGYRVGLWLPA